MADNNEEYNFNNKYEARRRDVLNVFLQDKTLNASDLEFFTDQCLSGEIIIGDGDKGRLKTFLQRHKDLVEESDPYYLINQANEMAIKARFNGKPEKNADEIKEQLKTSKSQMKPWHFRRKRITEKAIRKLDPDYWDTKHVNGGLLSTLGYYKARGWLSNRNAAKAKHNEERLTSNIDKRLEYAELRWFSRDFGKKLKLKAQLAFRPSIQKQLNRVAKNGDIAQLTEIHERYQRKQKELNPPSSTTKLAGRKTKKQQAILDLIVKSSEQSVNDLEAKRDDMLRSMHKQNKGLTNKIDKLMDKYSLNKTEENRQEQTVQKEEEQQKNNGNTNTNVAEVQSGPELPNAVLDEYTATNGNKVKYQYDATNNLYNIKNKDAGYDEISAMVEKLRSNGVRKVKLDTTTLTADQLVAFLVASDMEIANKEDVIKAIDKNKKQADNTVEISTMEKAAEAKVEEKATEAKVEGKATEAKVEGKATEAKVEENRGEDSWIVSDALALADMDEIDNIKANATFKKLPSYVQDKVLLLHDTKKNELSKNGEKIELSDNQKSQMQTRLINDIKKYHQKGCPNDKGERRVNKNASNVMQQSFNKSRQNA